ncbi:caspase family protein [Flammeovirga yaeyamensis]|uniref:Caspase family protein n=1 Tax=Flammeovirga yaeyamensis TaxID=367791 RepID=A0AAX1N641_9BACT|nr:caspase family protein [Flammeovirga yaeyamensis]MBB3697499.1 WD40 repeat protein/uncharacterized caspase-like protein [Flammeovirga yaeyamensis]NMF36193.1 hypothetical protein [Flammeovirga yaeyamensis]QWG02925.1 caspase family protein [Flammeovirga yaeyamensis]
MLKSIAHTLFLLLCFSVNVFSQQIHLTLSQGHVGEVIEMAISDDAKLLATVGEDGSLKLWNTDEKRLLDTIFPHEYGVSTLCFSNDNKYLATAGKDRSVKVWSLEDRKLLYQYDSLDYDIVEMRFVQGYLLFINKGGMIYRFDWQKIKSTPDGLEVKANFGNFSSINYNREIKWLGAGYMNGMVGLWRGYDRPTIEEKLHDDWVSDIDFVPEDSLVISASWDKTIKVWDANNRKVVCTLKSPDNTPFIDIVYAPYFKILCVKTQTDRVYFYKVNNGIIEDEPVGIKDDMLLMKFTKDRRFAAFTHRDGSFSLWSLHKNQKSFVEVNWRPQASYPKCALLDPNSSEVSIGLSNGKIQIWRPKVNTTSIVFQAHEGSINALSYNTVKQTHTTAGSDSLLKIWNNRGQNLHTTKLNFVVKSMKNVPLNNHDCIGGDDGGVYLFNDITQNLRKLYDHNRDIIEVSVSNSGRFISSISSDRSLKIYDFRVNKVVFSDFISDVQLQDVSFNETDGLLLVGGKHHLFLFDAVTFKLIKKVETDAPIQTISYLNKSDLWLIGKLSGEIVLMNDSLEKQVNQFDFTSIPMVTLLPFEKQDVFFTVRRDMSLDLMDVYQEEPMGKLIVTDDGDWVLKHVTGLFDVGDLNMENIYYVYGNETIDFDQLKDMYWEPGLGQELIERQELRKVPSLSDLKLYPDAEVEQKDKTLWIHLNDRGGGVGTVSLFINNKEVIHDLKDVATIEQKDNKEYYKVPISMLEGNLMDGKNNEISVIATNQENTLSGRGLKLQYKGKDVELEVPPTLYAIVVGVSNYRGRLLDLRYASKDAQAVAEVIEDGSENLFGIQNTDIQLISSDVEDNLPSKENIRKAFKNVSNKANSSDVLFVFLAGHGTVGDNEDGGKDFYFLTKDMVNSDIKDHHIRTNYSINGSELMEWIKEIPISKQVFVIDACHAGSFSTNQIVSRDDNEEGLKKRALEKIRSRTGMFMLSGASADKVSYESSILKHGLLTYSLLDYMKFGALNEGKFVDVQNLFTYAIDKVPELADDMQGEQQPEYRMPRGAGSFYIGELATDDRKKIILSLQKNRIADINFEEEKTWIDQKEIEKKFVEKIILNDEEYPFYYQKGAEGTDVYELKGRYKVGKKGIKLNYRLISEDKLIGEWEITAENEGGIVDQVINQMLLLFDENQ